MREPWDRPPRKPEDWDVELPFPPPEPLDTGPVSLYEDRCYSCGESYSGRHLEPCYLICGECLHAWFTEEEFVAHDASWRGGKRRPAAAIPICPCCWHDL